MSVTVITEMLDGDVVKVTEESSLGAGTTLYWYVWGVLVAADFITERIFSLVPGRPFVVQVLDTTAAPEEAYPGIVPLQWYAVESAEQYLVQEYVDSAWTTRRAIVSDGEEVFSHDLPWQEDGTAIQWRVVPVNAENIEGDPLDIVMTVVCMPSAVETTATYDADTQRVTLAAA